MSGLKNSNIKITPIEHATMVLKWNDKIIYTDPVGGAGAFAGQPAPDLILLTHVHGDHMDEDTLKAVSKSGTVIIAPKSVAEKLPSSIPGTILAVKNGQQNTEQGFTIEAVPMYNLPESPNNYYHLKGDGNSYVVETGGMRIFISGDSADTPEIDIAFVSMNLPYTMDVQSAASAVLDFKPKQIYPYHYRGTNGFSDLKKFKELVNNGNPNIEVVLLDWYPDQK